VGNVVLGGCDGLPEQEAVVYKAFFKQLQKASHLQLLDLVRNLRNRPISAEGSTQSTINPRDFYSALIISS